MLAEQRVDRVLADESWGRWRCLRIWSFNCLTVRPYARVSTTIRYPSPTKDSLNDGLKKPRL